MQVWHVILIFVVEGLVFDLMLSSWHIWCKRKRPCNNWQCRKWHKDCPYSTKPKDIHKM